MRGCDPPAEVAGRRTKTGYETGGRTRLHADAGRKLPRLQEAAGPVERRKKERRKRRERREQREGRERRGQRREAEREREEREERERETERERRRKRERGQRREEREKSERRGEPGEPRRPHCERRPRPGPRHPAGRAGGQQTAPPGCSKGPRSLSVRGQDCRVGGGPPTAPGCQAGERSREPQIQSRGPPRAGQAHENHCQQGAQRNARAHRERTGARSGTCENPDERRPLD